MNHLTWVLATAAAFSGNVRANNAPQFAERDGSASAQSPPFYPSPWMNPKATDWESAYEQAKAFVSQMTLMEKVNLTTGVGYVLFVYCFVFHFAFAILYIFYTAHSC